MKVLNIYDIVHIVRKSFLRILAFALVIGIITFCVASSLQTYTCSLSFKYNHEGAAEGLAPDGTSKLDPYEIQNPVVIQAALKGIGIDDSKKADINGIRQNISISKVVTELDSEVSESAALLGEKYEAPTTEYRMKLTYNAHLGDKFGPKMFTSIINEYDEFLLDKYYQKKTVSDFAKIVDKSSADYINIADIMASEIDRIIEYLDSMAEWYPQFRSKNTGYTFGELATIYQKIRNVQHAKYYGNIRAGNLAKDPEMVIKSYQTRCKELGEEQRVSKDISEKYKASIVTFYDSYKAAGLYKQAENVQENADSSNNRDKEIIDHYDVEEYINTYDGIVTSYVDQAITSAKAGHDINYYTSIINSYKNDTVDKATKDRLLEINEQVFEEIRVLSAKYSDIANQSIQELFDTKVTTDLQYLIAPEIVTDVPVKFITLFSIVLAFGLLLMLSIFIEFAKSFAQTSNGETIGIVDTEAGEKAVDASEEMDDLHRLIFEQHKRGFDEFYLVYQDMLNCKADDKAHMETFIRWNNPKLGMVSPARIIECVSQLDIFDSLNEWVIMNVCKDIKKIYKKTGEYPVIHINCPHSELGDFKINDIIIKCLKETDVPASCICLELNGEEISASLEEIMLVKKMGISVCIDRFENSDENDEIIGVIEPEYVKMSLDILNYDMYATSKDDIISSAFDMITYLSEVIRKCHNKKIKVCLCGVEDKSQDKIVSMIDLDYKQGYFYSKPKEL